VLSPLTQANAEDRPAQTTVKTQRPYLFASGRLEGENLVLDPWTLMERPAGFSDTPGEGPYRIVLVGADDTPLFERHFDMNTYEVSWLPQEIAAADAGPLYGFYEILRWHPETARIQIWHGDNLLAERSVSAHPPVVELRPHFTEPWTIDRQYVIEWEATDEDGDPLWFDVAFSRDGGETWDMLATRVQETRLVVDGALFPGTENALIRVYASDGVLSSAATSEPFAIEPKPPMAFIRTPQDGTLFPVGSPVPLRGEAYDPEEGELGGEHLTWVSDRDGVLGQGNRLMVTSLSPGWHTLTLRAVDSTGRDTTASVRVYVGQRMYVPVLIRR